MLDHPFSRHDSQGALSSALQEFDLDPAFRLGPGAGRALAASGPVLDAGWAEAEAASDGADSDDGSDSTAGLDL